MQYFFVNTPQVFFQCLALHDPTKKAFFFISDKCPKHHEIVSVLRKHGIESGVDAQYGAQTKLGAIWINFKKLVLYNLYMLFKVDTPGEVFINGDISSPTRLKHTASCKNICYLDGGYQHYFLRFLGHNNLFYRAYKYGLLTKYFRGFTGFRLNFRDEKISRVIYTNSMLVELSDCVDRVKAVGKYTQSFGLIGSMRKHRYKMQIIEGLFPSYRDECVSVSEPGKKTVCLLTQPFFEDGHFELSKNIEIYRLFLQSLEGQDVLVYLKGHPREIDGKYSELEHEFDLKILRGNYPFELYELNACEFDLGVSYNSTAVFSSVFTDIRMLTSGDE